MLISTNLISYHNEFGLDKMLDIFAEAGFEALGVYGDYDGSAPEERTERLYFVARALK